MIKISLKNGKLGTIRSFSLAPGLTCPGKSEWCIKCYADVFYRQYPSVRNAYADNLEAAELGTFVDAMVSTIRCTPKGAAPFRIHVAGDFYSLDYIARWIDIIKLCPDTKFWGYTRSWNIPELLPALELLRALPNVQLFASWDETMPDPPADWRKAYVGGTDKAYDCPEQNGRKKDCKACQYCFLGKKGNVRFQEH